MSRHALAAQVAATPDERASAMRAYFAERPPEAASNHAEAARLALADDMDGLVEHVITSTAGAGDAAAAAVRAKAARNAQAASRQTSRVSRARAAVRAKVHGRASASA